MSPFKLSDAASRGLVGDAIVAGYGTIESSNPSLQLLFAEIPLVTNAVCNSPASYAGDITDSMICAGAGGIVSCQGDSGGPLLVKRGEEFILVGVVSFGEGSGLADNYGVCTRVAGFADWIREAMEPPSSD